jgi:hypothetical protein
MTQQQPLSPNQVDTLHALRAAGSMTTAAVVALPFVHSQDQARNLLSRLEKRGHVVGEGVGRDRVWTFQPSEELDVALGPNTPASPGPRNGAHPETGVRTYVVLERRLLDELVGEIAERAGVEFPEDLARAVAAEEPIFERVLDPQARNTEHALRIAAKATYEDALEAAPQMVAVAERMFQVETVLVRNQSTVSIKG